MTVDVENTVKIKIEMTEEEAREVFESLKGIAWNGKEHKALYSLYRPLWLQFRK